MFVVLQSTVGEINCFFISYSEKIGFSVDFLNFSGILDYLHAIKYLFLKDYLRSELCLRRRVERFQKDR